MALHPELCFRASQNVADNQFLKSLDTSLRHLNFKLACRRESSFHDGLAELFLEKGQRTEETWPHEAEQTPELLQIILHWGA